MADWRKMAKQILLADGTIDEREVAALRKEFFADNSIDDIELEFLFDLRNTAKGVKASFNVLLIDALKNCMLVNGTLKPGGVSTLRHLMVSNGQLDAGEKVFVQHLRAALKQPSPDLDSFCKQYQVA